MENVTKVYELKIKEGWFHRRKEQRVAVKNLSLELHPGEIVGLLGLNGAGKTTTIKMLSTLLQVSSGSITIDGLDIERHRRQIQSKVNMIAGGERMLYWRLTGRENLQYFGRLYGLSEVDIEQRTKKLLAEVGLEEAADLPVEKYSKGMKQRLQIARGLINDPAYLFLDEPTLGLDAPIARQLRAMVRRLAKEQGKGILLTSHYLQEVEELCDRIYVIDNGEVLLCDSPQAVVRRVAGFEVVHFQVDWWDADMTHALHEACSLPPDSLSVLVDAALETVHLSIKTESTDVLIPQVLSWIVPHGIHILAVQVEKPTLEDAIIRISEGRPQDYAVLASVSS